MNEREYHKKRRMFCIIGGKVYAAPKEDEKSHKEWMKELGFDRNYEEIVRGAVYEDKLIFFRGNYWQADEEAEKIFFESIEGVSRELDLPEDVDICGGCVVGVVGDFWPPKKVFGKLKNLIQQ